MKEYVSKLMGHQLGTIADIVMIWFEEKYVFNESNEFQLYLTNSLEKGSICPINTLEWWLRKI